jgi:seryl-tRNA synthetase
MRIVDENVAFRGVDAELVRRKVIKRKYLLKRMRAKDRKAVAKDRRAVLEVAVACEQEEEFKKQRNRMSAQISRDKKKEKVKALEELNEELQQQCERHRQENDQLRAEIERSQRM